MEYSQELFRKTHEATRPAMVEKRSSIASITFLLTVCLLSNIFLQSCSQNKNIRRSNTDAGNVRAIPLRAKEPPVQLSDRSMLYVKQAIKRISPKSQLEVEVTDSDTVYAFYDNRKKIYISKSLICAAKREGAFLFVLAHEIAHHTHRMHTLEADTYTEELAADNFATKTILSIGASIGDALYALETLSRKQISENIDYPSLQTRLDAIVNQYKPKNLDTKRINTSSAHFCTLLSDLQCQCMK